MSAEAKPMPVELQIAKDLSLPLEAVTQTFAILAKRRAGKSFTARRFTEQLHRAGQQLVIVDPKGDWWGVRSSADGKAPGLPIVILGGERGDVKLEASAGEVISKLIVEESISALLDLSLLRKHEVATFMAIFLEGLYRLKAREQYRTPLMLVIDEADAIAPQRPMKGEERMLGAAEDIVRRGGQRGIGCMMVSQRSAVLNKNLLTQAQVLVALRTISPQDLGAMDAWIDVHGTQEERKTLMESLPALPTGDAWFWSPGWPTLDGIFKRVHVLPIKTFDSGATPEPGKKRIEPKNLADIDFEALSRQMAATIERAKAEDPKELRRRIHELESELRKAKAAAPSISPEENSRIRQESAREVHSQYAPRVERIVELAKSIELAGAELSTLSTFMGAITEPRPVNREARLIRTPQPIRTKLVAAPDTYLGVRSVPSGDGPTGGLRRMLTALAQRNPLSAVQLGVRAGLSSSSGTFGTYLGKARSEGWISGSRERLEITKEGLSALGSYDPLPEGRELQAYWLGELGGGAARMLEELCRAYPRSLTAEELGEKAGLSAASGTFGTYLGKLRTLELLTGSRSELRASEELFSMEPKVRT